MAAPVVQPQRPGDRVGWWQRLTGKGYAPWAVRFGPAVLGVVSLVVSLYSAHAIRWVLSPLDSIDLFEPVMTWLLAGAIGVMGYFVTRCLAFRMMNKERVRGYVFICVLVELVEVFCNVFEALVTMHRSQQLQGFDSGLQSVLTVGLCVVWSCVPLYVIGLAVMEMDLEREKRGMVGPSVSSSVGKPTFPPPGPSADARPTWARGATPAPGPSTPPARPMAAGDASQGAGVSRPGVSTGDAAARQGALINWQKRQGQPGQKGKQNGQGLSEDLLKDLEDMPALS